MSIQKTTNLQRKLPLLLLANRCVHSNQHTIFILVFHKVVLPNDVCQEIGGHDGCLFIGYHTPILITLQGFFRLDRLWDTTQISNLADQSKQHGSTYSSSWLELTMLDRATLSLGTTSVTSKVAFTAGSSQHGKDLLASVACHESPLLVSADHWCTLTVKSMYRLMSIMLHRK